jgi:hypothetical protein
VPSPPEQEVTIQIRTVISPISAAADTVYPMLMSISRKASGSSAALIVNPPIAKTEIARSEAIS